MVLELIQNYEVELLCSIGLMCNKDTGQSYFQNQYNG